MAQMQQPKAEAGREDLGPSASSQPPLPVIGKDKPDLTLPARRGNDTRDLGPNASSEQRNSDDMGEKPATEKKKPEVAGREVSKPATRGQVTFGETEEGVSEDEPRAGARQIGGPAGRAAAEPAGRAAGEPAGRTVGGPAGRSAGGPATRQQGGGTGYRNQGGTAVRPQIRPQQGGQHQAQGADPFATKETIDPEFLDLSKPSKELVESAQKVTKTLSEYSSKMKVWSSSDLDIRPNAAEKSKVLTQLAQDLNLSDRDAKVSIQTSESGQVAIKVVEKVGNKQLETTIPLRTGIDGTLVLDTKKGVTQTQSQVPSSIAIEKRVESALIKESQSALPVLDKWNTSPKDPQEAASLEQSKQNLVRAYSRALNLAHGDKLEVSVESVTRPISAPLRKEGGPTEEVVGYKVKLTSGGEPLAVIAQPLGTKKNDTVVSGLDTSKTVPLEIRAGTAPSGVPLYGLDVAPNELLDRGITFNREGVSFSKGKSIDPAESIRSVSLDKSKIDYVFLSKNDAGNIFIDMYAKSRGADGGQKFASIKVAPDGSRSYEKYEGKKVIEVEPKFTEKGTFIPPPPEPEVKPAPVIEVDFSKKDTAKAEDQLKVSPKLVATADFQSFETLRHFGIEIDKNKQMMTIIPKDDTQGAISVDINEANKVTIYKPGDGSLAVLVYHPMKEGDTEQRYSVISIRPDQDSVTTALKTGEPKWDAEGNSLRK